MIRKFIKNILLDIGKLLYGVTCLAGIGLGSYIVILYSGTFITNFAMDYYNYVIPEKSLDHAIYMTGSVFMMFNILFAMWMEDIYERVKDES